MSKTEKIVVWDENENMKGFFFTILNPEFKPVYNDSCLNEDKYVELLASFLKDGKNNVRFKDRKIQLIKSANERNQTSYIPQVDQVNPLQLTSNAYKKLITIIKKLFPQGAAAGTPSLYQPSYFGFNGLNSRITALQSISDPLKFYKTLKNGIEHPQEMKDDHVLHKKSWPNFPDAIEPSSASVSQSNMYYYKSMLIVSHSDIMIDLFMIVLNDLTLQVSRTTADDCFTTVYKKGYPEFNNLDILQLVFYNNELRFVIVRRVRHAYVSIFDDAAQYPNNPYNSENRLDDNYRTYFIIRHCPACHNTTQNPITKAINSFYGEYSICMTQLFKLLLTKVMERDKIPIEELINLRRQYRLTEDIIGSSIVFRAILTAITLFILLDDTVLTTHIKDNESKLGDNRQFINNRAGLKHVCIQELHGRQDP